MSLSSGAEVVKSRGDTVGESSAAQLVSDQLRAKREGRAEHTSSRKKVSLLDSKGHLIPRWR